VLVDIPGVGLVTKRRSSLRRREEEEGIAAGTAEKNHRKTSTALFDLETCKGAAVLVTAGYYKGRTGVVIGRPGERTYQVEIPGVGVVHKRQSSLEWTTTKPSIVRRKKSANSKASAGATAVPEESTVTNVLPIDTLVTIVAGISKGSTGRIVGKKGEHTYVVELPGILGTVDKRSTSVQQVIENEDRDETDSQHTI
jgi:ribosomal protein L24